jgi:hypothetical protein
LLNRGNWANYDDIHATFPEDWQHFNQRERNFFGGLWKVRVVSGARTVGWMLRQQLRLLHPNVLREVGVFAWILYWPLQIVSSAALLFAWFRDRELIAGFINPTFTSACGCCPEWPMSLIGMIRTPCALFWAAPSAQAT